MRKRRIILGILLIILVVLAISLLKTKPVNAYITYSPHPDYDGVWIVKMDTMINQGVLNALLSFPEIVYVNSSLIEVQDANNHFTGYGGQTEIWIYVKNLSPGQIEFWDKTFKVLYKRFELGIREDLPPPFDVLPQNCILGKNGKWYESGVDKNGNWYVEEHPLCS